MLRFTLLILTVLAASEAYRILVIYPMPAKSHNSLGVGFVNHLLDAGHEVVFVTPFSTNNPHPKLKEVNIMSIFEQLQTIDIDIKGLGDMVGTKENFAETPMFLTFTSKFSSALIENQVFNNFLSDPQEEFDVVIAEWFFSEIFAGVAPLFRCPLIWASTTEAHWQNLRVIDDIMNPAYSVDLFSNNMLPLSYLERVQELWKLVKRLFTIVPMETTSYNELYPPIAAKRGVTMPPYLEAAYNASLMFLNSHPSMGIPYRLPQNAKHIGGYHLNTKVEPLPKELQKIMDEAKNGVIYFSMGSNLQSKDLSQEMRTGLLTVFGELKQTVIWKFEDKIEDLPKNVHLQQWAPQQSIFAHPNLKLFITHGGQLSTIEAIHFGIPVVGIPVYGDQFVNMQLTVQKGYGLTVELTEDLPAQLRGAIRKILTDHSYTQKAKELSAIFNDRVIPPGVELVYWVEHVVRTRGADHLRSPALMVPWYQKAYLDLAAVVLVAIISLLAAVKYLKNIFCSKKKDKVKLS